mmetsp:Transcript_44420/g.114902  ORF Transcript_44420/g.114902 Transcript_44420/m.114902 type:complete len:340 (-) Transcript_44420:581-1600(-)
MPSSPTQAVMPVLVRSWSLACALAAAAQPSAALDRPNHELFDKNRRLANASSTNAEVDRLPADRPRDRCMKDMWPNVVDTCGGPVVYFGACTTRVGGPKANFHESYGTCGAYCESFGFQCSGGRAVATGDSGCPQDSTWVPCNSEITADEAVCTCGDRMDTFLWQDAKKLCGSGKALVGEIDKYNGSCDNYCKSLGLTCESASAAVQGCEVAEKGSCGAKMEAGGRGTVCECSGTYDRSGAHRWPDSKEVCGIATVLVDGSLLESKYSGSCTAYCDKLGGRVPGYDMHFFCYGSWQAKSGTCSEYQHWSQGATDEHDFMECAHDMHGSDAVCSCSFLDL